MRAGVRTTVCFFLLAAAVAAFTHTGSVRSAGRPIPGATVRAVQGGLKVATTTDEEGIYVLQLPSPGRWRIEVEMFGFAAARREIEDASKLTAIDWELELKPRLPSQPANGEGFQNVALNEAPEAAVSEMQPAPEPPAHTEENLSE
ncbi:MAG: carboxypeptidase-like regulatory domain-containing protein, partial [Acidobacteria bacterium]|nr:carboxypeptidase-like regulatory domain-containing protein [Acidobacteriota bacterium]